MMAESPRVILRLPKIRKAVVASQEPMLRFSKIRIELEMLKLERWEKILKWRKENGIPDESDLKRLNDNGMLDESDAILQEIMRRRGKILMELEQLINMEGSDVNDMNGIEKRILM
ncbi:hypothetical protein DPMN_039993 [Dreissena polymorpha]|uniref:Uncharacterized protein n=1 Tax=Dreissena polymorpha TaxID=45954 RepID=A0A9D4CWW7_DREPO|nr:hypothetical protein DPMN_039993 [Dreissena polymorpha]